MGINNSSAESDDLFRHKPEWLKVRLPHGFKTKDVVGLLNEHHLHTICSSGLCPNRAECWGAGTATFMICGNICTRNCKFCNVTNHKPLPLDPSEPDKVAQSIKSLGLRHVVITSVDRDDLDDFGAGHWRNVISTVKSLNPGLTMEVLIPDFRGRHALIDMIMESEPDIISHNMETVRRLTPEVRSVATYDCSLEVISYVSSKGFRSKSGIMLGLGETEEEILRTMDDLREAGCDVMTLGQYLQPSKNHFPVKDYITPDTFERYRIIGYEKGFKHVESAPMVRSSYHAEKHIK